MDTNSNWFTLAIWGIQTAVEVLPELAGVLELLTKAKVEERDITDEEMAAVMRARLEAMENLRAAVRYRNETD